MRATIANVSFEEYLKFCDGTDKRYELVDGELVEMPPARGKHADITDAFNDIFKVEIKRLGKDWISRHSSIGVMVPGVGRRATSRIPDICVVTASQWQELQNQFAVLVDSPPLLVVEVVSEGTKIIDHRRKRAEYNVVEIPEYWVVDFIENDPKYPLGVTVFTLVDRFYEQAVFWGNDRIISQIFPELTLTANQVLLA
ncbi:MAG: Uma2 family endonuclease [Fischerella sp.]|jgi:Uma2 family endonuclease|uniref:Uma2 family endonuclease n=1 Tax=Fischerella sp. TaxID=1191 RepID=UPI00184CA029|nr:Uma2 family endonuclease [Fischerella sp.]NWF57792.1 Uma2 family endonuclease [Fischerella sp.]